MRTFKKLFGLIILWIFMPILVFAQQVPVYNTSHIFSGNYIANWLFEHNQEIICAGDIMSGPNSRKYFIAKLDQNGDTISMVKSAYPQWPIGNNHPQDAVILSTGDVVFLSSEQIAGGPGQMAMRLIRMKQNGSFIFDSTYTSGMGQAVFNPYSVIMKKNDMDEILLFGNFSGTLWITKLSSGGNLISSTNTNIDLYPNEVIVSGLDYYVIGFDSFDNTRIHLIKPTQIISSTNLSVTNAFYGGEIVMTNNAVAVLLEENKNYYLIYLDKINLFPMTQLIPLSLSANLWYPKLDYYIPSDLVLLAGFTYDVANAKKTNFLTLNQNGVVSHNLYPVGGDDYPQDVIAYSGGVIVSGLSASSLFTISFLATTFIAEVKEQSFSVYPNPSNNDFSVSLSKVDKAQYEIFDSSGRLVKSGMINNREKIHLENSGLYYLKILNSSIKLIKID